MKPGDRVRIGKGKKVHMVKGYVREDYEAISFCGEWVAGFPYRNYFKPTTDPVTCKTCLRAGRGK